MNDQDKACIENDLLLMINANLVDISMREDGEWLYTASEYSKTLTPEQLNYIIDNLDNHKAAGYESD